MFVWELGVGGHMGFQLSKTKPPHLAAHRKPQQEIKIYKDNREQVGRQHPTRLWKRIAKPFAKGLRSHSAPRSPAAANLRITAA